MACTGTVLAPSRLAARPGKLGKAQGGNFSLNLIFHRKTYI